MKFIRFDNMRMHHVKVSGDLFVPMLENGSWWVRGAVGMVDEAEFRRPIRLVFVGSLL